MKSIGGSIEFNSRKVLTPIVCMLLLIIGSEQETEQGNDLPSNISSDYTRKRVYACAYLKWMRNGEQGESPEHPDLSYMAAQAVRMNLMETINDNDRESC